MYCDECSQACAFCSGTYVALRDENERLRAAIRDVIAYEWGDPAKGNTVPENQPVWRALQQAGNAEEKK